MDWKGKSRSSEQERVQDEAEFSGLLATLCAISWILASLTLFDNSCVGPLAARCAQDIPRPPTPSSDASCKYRSSTVLLTDQQWMEFPMTSSGLINFLEH